jgi:hypothetical protein
MTKSKNITLRIEYEDKSFTQVSRAINLKNFEKMEESRKRAQDIFDKWWRGERLTKRDVENYYLNRWSYYAIQESLISNLAKNANNKHWNNYFTWQAVVDNGRAGLSDLESRHLPETQWKFWDEEN